MKNFVAINAADISKGIFEAKRVYSMNDWDTEYTEIGRITMDEAFKEHEVPFGLRTIILKRGLFDRALSKELVTDKEFVIHCVARYHVINAGSIESDYTDRISTRSERTKDPFFGTGASFITKKQAKAFYSQLRLANAMEDYMETLKEFFGLKEPIEPTSSLVLGSNKKH